MRISCEEIVQLSLQGAVLMRDTGNLPNFEMGHTKVPEPTACSSAQDAKPVENFLFNMEQFFEDVRPNMEQTEAGIASGYLSGGVKLSWRSKHDEI